MLCCWWVVRAVLQEAASAGSRGGQDGSGFLVYPGVGGSRHGLVVRDASAGRWDEMCTVEDGRGSGGGEQRFLGRGAVWWFTRGGVRDGDRYSGVGAGTSWPRYGGCSPTAGWCDELTTLQRASVDGSEAVSMEEEG